MQALCGRIRTLRRHAIESSNVYAFNSIRGGSVSGAPLLTSLDSKSLYLNGVVATNSHGHLLRLLPEFSSNSTLVVHKKFGSRLESLSQSRNNHTASIAPFSRDATTAFQLATMVPIFPRRCISTNVNSAESISEDTSPSASDVPPRIKFKRLDKTARHIMQILNKEAVEEMKTQREIPDIRPGYIIQLKVEVPENKRRVSIVKGIVIARRNAGPNTTFRLRRLVAGVGVESLFPLYSPNIKEIKVLEKKKVRRAKLYYLRDKMNALKK